MKTVVILLALSLVSATAQTLKWSHPLGNIPGVTYARAGDGLGGVALALRLGSTDRAATILWIGPGGKTLLNAEIERPHEDSGVSIVRLTATELAIRYYKAATNDHGSVNTLRRYKRTGRGVVITDTALAFTEELPRVPENLTDRFGFFSFLDTEVRRYSN